MSNPVKMDFHLPFYENRRGDIRGQGGHKVGEKKLIKFSCFA